MSGDVSIRKYMSDNGIESSGGEGAEIAPYINYSSDSTVSMETEDSHGGIVSDSPINGRSLSSNCHHVAFGFLDKQEDIVEEEDIESKDTLPPGGDNGVLESGGIDIGEDESNGSTAEEVDSLPLDSGTTEEYGGNNIYRWSDTRDEGIVGYTGITEIISSTTPQRHSYENWSIIEEHDEISRKRRMVSRAKFSRVGLRQRAPQPLPRSNHLKQKPSRPQAPVPRKRRVSGRLRPSSRNMPSEGDMEQADEMGPDEGEGDNDDGFVDGGGGEGKKKTKKKLMPSLPALSPLSSPSNTPISRRRLSSRKNRAKPKGRKNLKPTLASADISTQETTTPGPPTSDSDQRGIEDIVEEEMSIRGASIVTKRPSPTTNGIIKKLDSNSRTASTESITKKTSTTTRTYNGKTSSAGSGSIKPSGAAKSVTTDDRSSPSSNNDSYSRLKKDNERGVSSETSDTSDNDRKTASSTGVSTSSPQTSRKLSNQENLKPRTGRLSSSSNMAGKFVSQRTSVAARISQFDSSDGSKQPGSPTAKNTSPITKRSTLATKSSPYIQSSNNKSNDTVSTAGKRPSPFGSKPPTAEVKPKSPSPTETKPESTDKTVELSNALTTKDPPKPSAVRQSVYGSLSKPNPPLPPKPKSPTALKQSTTTKTVTNSLTGSSSSTSSLSSSSTSSISKAKTDESKSKQPVVRKSSLVRASSNLSLTGKTNGSTTNTKTTSNKLPSSTQRRPSPVQSSSILPNKSTPFNGGRTTNGNKVRPTSGKESAAGKVKSDSPPVTTSLGEGNKSLTGSKGSLRATSPVPTPRTTGKLTKSVEGKAAPTVKQNSSEKGAEVGSESTNDSTDNGSSKENISAATTTGKQSSWTDRRKNPSVERKSSPAIDRKKNPSTEQKQSPSVERKASPTSDGEKVTKRNSKVVSHSALSKRQSVGQKTTEVKNTSKTTDTHKTEDSDSTKQSKAAPNDSSIVVVKPPLQAQKSSSRRPPPDPPVSPPIRVQDQTDIKKKPRVRSPPPPPPTSVSPVKMMASDPTKKKPSTGSGNIDNRDEDCQSPRNYEEFVPSIFRTNSMLSNPSSPPPPPVRTKGEYSTNSSTSLSAYEDVVLPVTTSLPPGGLQRNMSLSSVESSSFANQLNNEDLNYSECVPPPLPPRNYPIDDPVISLPSVLCTVDENNKSPTKTTLSRKTSKDPFSSEDDSGTPPPLPSQPIPRRKSFLGSPLLKRKEIKIQSSASSLVASPPVQKRDMENVYEEIDFTSRRKPLPKKSSHYETADNIRSNHQSRDSSPADSIDGSTNRRFSASVCVSTTVGLSPVSIRRANSDKMKHNRLPVVVTASLGGNGTNKSNQSSLQRAPSMDVLDDRMNQSTVGGTALPTTSNNDNNTEYSSDEDEVTGNGSVSPNQGLPELPKSNYMLGSSPKDSMSSTSKLSDYSDEEQEPLYQHINHLDFTSTPWMSKNRKINDSKPSSPASPILTKQGSNNQLEIARHLSVNHRKLWCEQPEVLNSGLLSTMSDQDRKLQEAMYEVITSEVSYLRSLDVLIDHFMSDPGMNPNLPDERRVLSKRQHQIIFSNVQEIRQVSAKFLHELRERQRQSLVLDNICDIIRKYAESEFGCYVTYCTNQVYQMREITEMLYSHTMFIDYIKRLESHKKCQCLSITSFLLLPMQRITRLPLLVLAILNRMPSTHSYHSDVEDTLRAVQKLVTACNDGARQMERTEELHQIHSQLNFAKLKPFPLVSISRRLERKGSLMMLEMEQRLFGKPRVKKVPVFVFAFTDLILITKRKKGPKGEVTYKVIDYASKAVVEIEKLKVSQTISYPKHTFGEHETIPRATWMVSSANEPHSFLLILLENSSQKVEKYILVCQNDTERTRWMESISHPAKEKQKEDETIYETWDCPQVQAVYDYTPEQHDELSLMRGDIVKVLRKMADGWYEGEKLRDLQWGWFPSNFTVEIENAHTRARNLKERHRLLSNQLDTNQFSEQFSVAMNK